MTATLNLSWACTCFSMRLLQLVESNLDLTARYKLSLDDAFLAHIRQPWSKQQAEDAQH